MRILRIGDMIATPMVARMTIFEASLSFLGLDVRESVPTW
jgi:ABC-type dipeptide/oligopeptide/nickel transport system permease subunit